MKKKILFGIYLLGLSIIAIFILNYILYTFYGLGNPIIYDDNPIYGYRPLPNQEIRRFNGKRIKINNLSLRCDTDWDTIKANKILFLGNSVTYGGSYIDNSELFSTLVTKGNTNLLSASGGVNGWGVNNIHGLLLKNNFYPAKNYISVLLEGDFQRGIATIAGNYFSTKKPYSALHEVANHYLTTYLQLQLGYYTGNFVKDRRMKLLVQEDAIQHLKQIDSTLKSKGFTHTIFISPSADQLFRNKPIDHDLEKMAKEYKLSFNYLLFELRKEKLVENEIYHDLVHLGVKVHSVWANKIKLKLKNTVINF